MDDLIAKLKEGDEAAFKEVMAMYKKPIFHYLSLLMGDRQLAEELTQDTFVKVSFKAGTLKCDTLSAAKAWIYTIATNLARSEFRKKRILRVFSISDPRLPPPSYGGDSDGILPAQQLLAIVPT